MYILKRIGPKIEPCGTPHVTGASEDLVSVKVMLRVESSKDGLIVLVNCDLLDRYDRNQFRGSPLIPIFSSLHSKIL